jgi:putative PIN family toxin of toxin-antitoxin system
LPPLVVVDTVIVIRSLIGSTRASSYAVIRAAGTGDVRLAHSDEGLRELVRIVEERDKEGQIASASRAFSVAMDIWAHGVLHHPIRRDWPSIPDQNDGWMLDLAFEATADFIVTWDRHLLDSELPFPIGVLKPPQLLAHLRAN